MSLKSTGLFYSWVVNTYEAILHPNTFILEMADRKWMLNVLESHCLALTYLLRLGHFSGTNVLEFYVIVMLCARFQIGRVLEYKRFA